jgi:hypothetical protein
VKINMDAEKCPTHGWLSGMMLLMLDDCETLAEKEALLAANPPIGAPA